MVESESDIEDPCAPYTQRILNKTSLLNTAVWRKDRNVYER